MAAEEGGTVDDAAILRLLGRVGERMTWAHVQKLRVIEGETGFTCPVEDVAGLAGALRSFLALDGAATDPAG